MADRKYVYPWSLKDAIEHHEVDAWRESYKHNCSCARAIEKAIEENYHDNRLETDAIRGIIAEYGYARVNWVLANTIQQHEDDGRYSRENKDWARSTYIPEDDVRWHFCVDSHPGLVNMFVDRARKEWQSLGLFDSTHCTAECNYEDRLLVMKPSSLKDEYKSPEYQLFFAVSGFGCDPNLRGTAVFGHFLKDGEYAQFRRSDFLGVIRDDCIPEWAQEKLQQYLDPKETADVKADVKMDEIQ